MARQMSCQLRRCPHVVETPPTIVLRPVWRTVAPPGEAAFGRGYEPASDIDPVVRLPKPVERFDLDRRMAHHIEQRLVTPDVAFERSDVEIADDDRRLAQSFGPAGHPPDEV